MRDKIRQWVMENPRAMNAAYALVLGSSVAFEFGVSIQEATGGNSGP